MQVHVSTDNHIEGTEELARHVEAVVSGALGRFGDQVTRVEAHLSDENSARKSGDSDKRCLMEARLSGLQLVAVTHRGATLEQAVGGAAEKLERALDRALGRLGGRKERTSHGGPLSAAPAREVARRRGAAMVVVLMGVSGSGKTTVGKALAEQLGWAFIEADDFHPAANVEKMRRGEPLDDDDRRPWLAALRRRVDQACEQGEQAVLACSALKHDYREYLERHAPECVHYVYLSGSEELIRRRLAGRKGHFMPPGLLASQFEALEPPEGALRVDITPAPDVIAAEVRRGLGL